MHESLFYNQGWQVNGSGGFAAHGQTGGYARNVNDTDACGNWSGFVIRLPSGDFVETVTQQLGNGGVNLADDLTLQGVSLDSLFVRDDYAAWRQQYFRDECPDEKKRITRWGDHADPDGDGLKNILEFIMGRDPLKVDNHLGPQVRVENGEITFSYRQTTATNHDVVSYVSWATDLEYWTTRGIVSNLVSSGDPIMIEANLVAHHAGQVFMRLEALRTGAESP